MWQRERFTTAAAGPAPTGFHPVDRMMLHDSTPPARQHAPTADVRTFALACHQLTSRARIVAGIAAMLVGLCGCTQEMANQPRLEPLEANSLSGEIVPPRAPLPGTVARGQYWLDRQFITGRADGKLATELPEAVSDYFAEDELLRRGAQRYNIFCSHCHGLSGGGTGGDIDYRPQVGMVVLRGFPTPPTYHQSRLREAPLGHFFEVITHGIGRMPAHGYMIPPEDRWAIAAYVKALQLSQHIPRELLAPDDLDQLARTGSEVE